MQGTHKGANRKPQKLDQQATEVTFMGFDKDFAYKFFDHKTNKMTIARDVIFYEDQFLGSGTGKWFDFNSAKSLVENEKFQIEDLK